MRFDKNDLKQKLWLSACILLLVWGSLSASIVVQDELTKVFSLARGENMSGGIMLYNPLNEPLTVYAYSADYVYTESGNDFYLESGKYNRSNANFIRFSSSHTIGANQSYLLPFTISIPQQNDLNGSYWSVIFIQSNAPVPSNSHNEISILPRYGIQIVTNIRNTGKVDLSFTDVSYDDNKISMSLKNTGTLWVEATIKIDIFDEAAIRVGSFSTNKIRIYPELVRNIEVSINPLLSSNYYAIIVADCGNNQIFGHQISFTIR